MKTINLKSVITTGILSGIVILASGLTMIPVVGDEMDKILNSRGLPPLSDWAVLFICLVSITIGIFLVFFYSLLKAHFNSKFKAAVTSSLVVFFVTYFLSNASLVLYGFMPLKFAAIGTLWGLGELLMAGIIVPLIYKDNCTQISPNMP